MSLSAAPDAGLATSKDSAELAGLNVELDEGCLLLTHEYTRVVSCERERAQFDELWEGEGELVELHASWLAAKGGCGSGAGVGGREHVDVTAEEGSTM